MAAAELDESHVFDNLPSDITIGQARQAWAKKELIESSLREGKGPKDIARRTSTPLKAVEWALGLITGQGKGTQQGGSSDADPSQSHSRAPAGARGEAARGSLGEEGREPPREDPRSGQDAGGLPKGYRPGFYVPAGNLDRERAGGGGQGPPQGGGIDPQERDSLLRSIYQEPTTDSMSAERPSPMSGRVEIPRAYEQVLNAWVLLGMKEEKARGILWAFQMRDEPRNLPRLRQMVTASGYAPAFADECVDVFKTALFPRKPDGLESPGDGDGESSERPPSMDELRRRVAGGAGQGVSAEQRAEMAAEIDRLEAEKIRLEIKARKRELGMEEAEAPQVEEDPIVDVVLNIGGIPQPRKIRQSQMAGFAAWLPKAGPGGQSADEPPPWAKAIMEEQAAARQRQAEADRRREQQEIVAQATGPLQEQIRQLTAKMGDEGGGSPMAKRLEALQNELAKQRSDDLQNQLKRLEAAVSQATTPEGLRLAQARYDAAARQLGYIPRSENSLLNEEQITLEAERRAAMRKDDATAKAIDLASRRLDGKPLIEVAEKFGIADAAKKLARNMTSSQEEREGIGQNPTDAEIEAEARRLAGMTGEPPPPPPGQGDAGGRIQGANGLSTR